MTAKRLFLLFVLSLAGAVSAFAQSNIIKGRVEDPANKAIAGATVILRNTKTGLERIASTDGSGQFEFRGLAFDPFQISGVAEGFAQSERVEASPGRDIVISLSVKTANEVVTIISGSRQEELRESLNTKVDVLTEKDIRNTGYETVGEVLREVPGVLTRRGSETTPPTGEQVQGIDSRQVLVLRDGQPVSGARGVKSGIINLDRQTIGPIESVEVVKGAASALYGSDAIGGVINLRTKEPVEPFTASITAAVGNFGVFDGRGSAGFVKDRLSGYFDFGRHKNNGFDLFPADFTTDGSGYHRNDLYGKLKYRFTDNFSLIGFGNSYWNNSKGRVVGEPTAGNFSGRQIIDVDDQSQDYGLTADWAIDGRTNLQVRGYYSRYDEIYRSLTQTGASLPDGNLFERYGKFDFTFSRLFGEHNFLQAGAEFSKNKYRGLYRLQNDEGDASNRVFWLQDKINLLRRLTFTVGGRADNHSLFGTSVSPKVGINVRLTDQAYLRASWGRGFRAPDLGQLFYNFRNPLFGYQVLGNANLSPEHSGSWQLGGEFLGFNRRARFGVNFFRNDVRNLINSLQLGMPMSEAEARGLLSGAGLDPGLVQYIQGYPVLLFAYLNTANVYTQGIEADGSYLLPYGFSVNGAYTFLEAIDKSTGRTLTGRHKHQGFAKVSYENPSLGFTANFRGTFFGNWWATTTRKAPAFQLFDLYAAKKLYKGFQLYGSIDNIFNSQDPNTGLPSASNPLVPMAIDRADAGRTFRLGIRWELSRGN